MYKTFVINLIIHNKNKKGINFTERKKVAHMSAIEAFKFQTNLLKFF